MNFYYTGPTVKVSCKECGKELGTWDTICTHCGCNVMVSEEESN